MCSRDYGQSIQFWRVPVTRSSVAKRGRRQAAPVCASSRSVPRDRQVSWNLLNALELRRAWQAVCFARAGTPAAHQNAAAGKTNKLRAGWTHRWPVSLPEAHCVTVADSRWRVVAGAWNKRAGPISHVRAFQPMPEKRVLSGMGIHWTVADSQGTSTVLCGDDLKSELGGLPPESILCAAEGFFFRLMKDALGVGLLCAQ